MGGVVGDREDAGRWKLENVGSRSELGMVDEGGDGAVADVPETETLAWMERRRGRAADVWSRSTA
jgi:hypothetical protein